MHSNSPQPARIGSLARGLGTPRRIAIIGGGASGTLMALQILRKSLETDVVRRGRPESAQGEVLIFSPDVSDNIRFADEASAACDKGLTTISSKPG